MPPDHEFGLTVACRDTRRNVHAVSGLRLQAGCKRMDSPQYGDSAGVDASGLFFMRVPFKARSQLAPPTTLNVVFQRARQPSPDFCAAPASHATDIHHRVQPNFMGAWPGFVEHRVRLNSHQRVVLHLHLH